MCKVIVIGSGASGTAAVNHLLDSGCFQDGDVVMVEAQHTTGGRTVSVSVGGEPVDLGASWIEDAGCNSDGEMNPMVVLASEYLVEHKRRGGHGRSLRFTTKADTTSALQQAGRMDKAAMRHVMEVRTHLLRNPELPDICVADAYAVAVEKFPPPTEEVTKWLDFYQSMGEQYYGDSFRNLSVRSWSSPGMYNGADQWVDGGYGNIVLRHLEAAVRKGLELHLGAAVCGVKQKPSGNVELTFEDGRTMEAQYVISTVPLGVLKCDDIKFTPDLPPAFQDSIQRLGFGLMNKVVLEFESPFWGDASSFAVACEERGRWRSWIAPFVDEAPYILICLVSSNAAEKLEAMSDDEIQADVLPMLNKTVCPNLDRLPRLLSFNFSRWQGNKYIKGGYSSYSTGTTPQTIATLTQPLWDSHLLFAGEHTNIDYCSVHGAHNSGICAARHVIKHMAQCSTGF
eukprot:TRINITY_DN24206_c0_g1_i1.p1 TRINITY_DN24206_c0_g1~~TRINITY_DN24206_c0_g1_i1.p1  ORF type:complete len:455 (+),score=58.59 TRINITY_DN24206_c0_g1_i1:34-1398(+)